eukprot:tig00020553_g10784.t1
MRYLTQNYRSHAGIVGLASTLLDVLEVLFPGALDRLPRDSAPCCFVAAGIREGEPPVTLRSGSEAALEAFLFGAGRGAADRRLGAEQVVLVRTAACKARVPSFLRQSVALTVEEAKGLEFDAILLLDFFRESRAEEDRLWREALRACEEEVVARATAAGAGSSAPGDGESSSRAQGPDPSAPRMQAIALELRLLYTAVTRAREQVWIFDADGGARGSGASRRQAFIGLLHKCRAVQDETTAGTAPRRVESTAADWRRKAREYERLGLHEAVARANAIAAELDAAATAAVASASGEAESEATGAQPATSGSAPEKPSTPPKSASNEARSQLLEKAKRALNRARERKNAAEKAEDLRSAAALLEQAGELLALRAAKAYLDAGEHGQSAELFDRAGQPAEAWSVWKQSGRWADAAAYYEARGCMELALEALESAGMWGECFELAKKHPALVIDGGVGGADEEVPPNVSSRQRGLAYYAFKCCLPLLEAVGADLQRDPPSARQLAAFNVLIDAVSERDKEDDSLPPRPGSSLRPGIFKHLGHVL